MLTRELRSTFYFILGVALAMILVAGMANGQTPQPGTYSGPDGKFIVCTQSGSIVVCR